MYDELTRAAGTKRQSAKYKQQQQQQQTARERKLHTYIDTNIYIYTRQSRRQLQLEAL